MTLARSLEILERLIAFETVSHRSNLALIDYAAELLRTAGAEVFLVHDGSGAKANLHATIGPLDRAGVLLSGHTDVVPVEDQPWTRPPFRLTEEAGRVFGRGTADMKGFVACALAAAERASHQRLRAPLALALSYDEEVGCIGVRGLIDALTVAPRRPEMVIVGEPTELAVATGHKGKAAFHTTCRGRAGHSALAPFALNALHLGADFLAILRAEQRRLETEGARDEAYAVPYSTIHAGRFEGGSALNVVPGTASLDWEIRSIAGEDANGIAARIEREALALTQAQSPSFPEVDIRTTQLFSYPGLDTPPLEEAVAVVQSLADTRETTKVAFGTEGGLFQEALDVPVVICGPGSMDQGHRPDEFIALAQLAACDTMLDRLIERLAAGL